MPRRPYEFQDLSHFCIIRLSEQEYQDSSLNNCFIFISIILPGTCLKFTYQVITMASPSSSTNSPPISKRNGTKDTLEDIFDGNTEFLDRSRRQDPVDSQLWEDLLGSDSEEQIFDQTVEFMDRGIHDESDLYGDLLYGSSK